jgi:hypothetical protein
VDEKLPAGFFASLTYDWLTVAALYRAASARSVVRPPRTQAFLSCFGPIRQHLALPRHQMTAARHRAILKERFANGTIGPSPALSMRLSVKDDYSYVEPVVDAH